MIKKIFSTTCIILLTLFFASFQSFGQVTKLNDWESAKQLAEKTNKNILVILTGAEWCKPCVKLEKNVIENEEFILFANARLVIFEINIPRHLDLDSKVVKEYVAFKEKYQTNALPALILTDQMGNAKTTITGGLSLKNVLDKLKEHTK